MKKIISISMVMLLIFATFTSCKKTDTEVSQHKVKGTISLPQNSTTGLDDNPKRVKGKIKKPSSAAIIGATVSVYDSNDELVIYTMSGELGIFNLDSVMPGTYNVVIEAVGYYANTVEDVSINNDGHDHDLGDIYMHEEE